MTSFDAQNITASFNPFGVFLRRWQIDDLHIDRAKIGIHVYEPTPEPKPAKPWYAIFLPDRVYLKRVWSDNVDVTWPMRGETAGVFKTHLIVTPHGRDFEYHANSGTLKNSPMPELPVDKIHLLITKKRFTLYNLKVNSGQGSVHASGSAATSGDKQVDFNFDWEHIPIPDWIPAEWRESVGGTALGRVRWTGKDFKLTVATMSGDVKIKGGRLTNLKFLDEIAAITRKPDLASLELNECRSKFRWHQTDCELTDIAIEQTGKFRIEGTIEVKNESLGGTLELGFAPEYLDWLPDPGEIFSRRKDRYLWTTIHLSGTLDSPGQDLSPRLIAALSDSPGALLSAALRGLGAWLNQSKK